MDRERDADHSLVELLYGELEGPARERAEARVAGDPALSTELEGLRALRGTFRTWGEESDAEPPGDLSALMAAARANAPPAAVAAEAPAPGLWERLSRWMAPLMAHPGLAAAATLVLVAGVAGTLYVTGGPTMVETTSAPAVAIEEAPAPVAAPAPTAPAPADLATEGAAAPAAAADSSAPARGAVVVGAAPEPVAGDRAQRERKAAPKAKASKADMDSVGDAELVRDQAPAKKAESASERTGTSAPTRAPSPSAQAPAAAPAPAAPPPPPPAAEPSPTAGADTAEPSAPGSELARLGREAREAAARGDCARVRGLSARVQAIDAAYHQRTFRGDKAIAACLATK
jgi:hypothetical protein